MSDEDLIRKVAAKDQQAMKALVDRYQDRVINICWNLLGRRADAEDVAQDVFFQVYKSAPRFRHEAKLSTWLYRIAVNRSLNFLRDHRWSRVLKRLQAGSQDDDNRGTDAPAPSSERPDKALENKEIRLVVYGALRSLPERQRAAFTLHNHEGLSYRETAEVLGCSVTSVESLLHRAKSNLQKKLLRSLEKR